MAKLHHIWLAAQMLDETAEFYRNVVGIEGGPVVMEALPTTPKFGPSHFMTDGTVELHFGKPDPTLNLRPGSIYSGAGINPLARTHFAFLVDDIEQAKQRLRTHNVPYLDLGSTQIKGRYQLYFYDPAGNVVEFQQYVDHE